MILTKAQRQAVFRLFQRSPDGSKNYREFRRRITGGHDYVGLKWCGMFIGIERDGYTHS